MAGSLMAWQTALHEYLGMFVYGANGGALMAPFGELRHNCATLPCHPDLAEPDPLRLACLEGYMKGCWHAMA